MAVKIYFGVPGSGKTTHAARTVYHNLRKGVQTYSNVPIKGSFMYDARDLGKYRIENCDLVIDEASIDFNNRKFKSLPQETIQFLKYYRHYGIRDIYVYSQSYEDMDITIRRLATEIYVVHRSLLPGVFFTRRIKVRIGIDEDTHQITDLYFFSPFSIRPYFGKLYFSMFDSWSTPALPDQDFSVTGFEDLDHPDKSTWKILRSGCLHSLLPRFLRRIRRSSAPKFTLKLKRGGKRRAA